MISYHFTSDRCHFYLFLICMDFTAKYKIINKYLPFVGFIYLVGDQFSCHLSIYMYTHGV